MLSMGPIKKQIFYYTWNNSAVDFEQANQESVLGHDKSLMLSHMIRLKCMTRELDIISPFISYLLTSYISVHVCILS